MKGEIEIGISVVQGNSDFTMFADGENIGGFHLGDLNHCQSRDYNRLSASSFDF